MKGRWNYANLGQVWYGNAESYILPAAWFDAVGGVLEDWGCGCAQMKQFVKKCKYVGLEGSKNDYADRCDVDLREHRSDVDCIFMRDVLDHNVEWPKILDNAVASFRKRMVLVIFRECEPETRIVFVNTSEKYPGVPDFAFRAGDLVQHFAPHLVKVDRINNETMFFLEKRNVQPER